MDGNVGIIFMRGNDLWINSAPVGDAVDYGTGGGRGSGDANVIACQIATDEGYQFPTPASTNPAHWRMGAVLLPGVTAGPPGNGSGRLTPRPRVAASLPIKSGWL